METPVLTQSQKSKALSGNKPKQKKKSNKIRNVLANFSSRSSIKLSTEDSITFEEKLCEIFHHPVRQKPKWNVVKKIPKEKRPEFRATLQKAKNPLTFNLIFGINEISRSIEKQTCTLVVISSDVNPAILMRHIHEGCKTHQIPLFEVADLRSISLKCFGFPTIAMAFKDIPDDLLMIKEFFVSFGVDVIQRNNNNKPDENVTMSVSENKAQTESVPEVIGREVYLLRGSKEGRCFVPPVSAPKCSGNARKTGSSMDFIELMSDESETNEAVYKNLKVKRIRANPERLKGKKKL